MVTRVTTTHPLTHEVSVDEYVEVLVRRQQAWLARNPCPPDVLLPPVWAGLPVDYALVEDEKWVRLPEPEEKTRLVRRDPAEAVEYHRTNLRNAEGRLERARAKYEDLSARADAAGLPKDPGALSGVTRSRARGLKVTGQMWAALERAESARRAVDRLESVVGTHRRRLEAAEARAGVGAGV